MDFDEMCGRTGNMDAPKFMGVVALMYSKLELMLELLAARQLEITARQCHIVFADMNMGNKRGVSQSLLIEADTAGNKAVCDSIGRAFELMRRNHIFHSVMTFGPPDQFKNVKFRARAAKNGLKVKAYDLSSEQMHEVANEFVDEITTLMDLAAITDDDLQAYIDELQ